MSTYKQFLYDQPQTYISYPATSSDLKTIQEARINLQKLESGYDQG